MVDITSFPIPTVSADSLVAQINQAVTDAEAAADRAEATPFIGLTGVVYGSVDATQRAANLAALIAAATTHHAIGGTLMAKGRVEIAGSDDVNIYGNVDFSGLTLGIAGYSGTITFANDYTETTYTSGAVFSAVVATTTFDKGSMYFDTWAGVDELEDAMVWIDTNVSFFGYRAAYITRTDLFHHRRNGAVTLPLEYDMNPATITAVRVRKNNKRRSVIHLPTLDYTGVDALATTTTWPIKVSTSNAEVHGGHVLYEAPGTTFSTRSFDFDGCCNVTVQGLSAAFQNIMVTGTSTYQVRYANTVGVTFTDCTGGGDGWGAMAGHENNHGLRFVRCDMSRFDWHQAFRNGISLDHCRIGTWGLYLTGTGDVRLNSCSFYIYDMESDEEANIIGTRSDTLGFVDGDLIMTDCSVFGIDAKATTGGTRLGFVYLWKCDGLTAQGDPSGTIVAASPIKHRMFRNITVNGFTNHLPIPVRVDPLFTVDTTNPIAVCEHIELRDMRVGAGGKGFKWLARSEDWNALSATGDVSLSVVMDGFPFDGWDMHSQDSGFVVDFQGRNVRPVEGGDGTVYFTAPGRYVFEGGGAYRVYPLDGTNHPVANIHFKWLGGYFDDLSGATQMFGIQTTDPTLFHFVSPTIVTNDVAHMAQIYRGRVDGETVIVSGSVVSEIELAPAAAAGVWTQAQTYLCENQIYHAKMTGPTSGSMYQPVQYPTVLGSVPAQFWNGSAMVSGYIRRSNTNVLTAVGYGTATLGTLVRLTGKGT